jgi:hypothetical protein
MQEIREHPPPMLKTSMTDPLGGNTGYLRASITYVEDVDDAPWGVMPEI